jgi:hypothetical protein
VATAVKVLILETGQFVLIGYRMTGRAFSDVLYPFFTALETRTGQLRSEMTRKATGMGHFVSYLN